MALRSRGTWTSPTATRTTTAISRGRTMRGVFEADSDLVIKGFFEMRVLRESAGKYKTKTVGFGTAFCGYCRKRVL